MTFQLCWIPLYLTVTARVLIPWAAELARALPSHLSRPKETWR